MSKKITIGLIGLGTVGSAVAKILCDNKNVITKRTSAELIVARAAVRTVTDERKKEFTGIELTDNPEEIVNDENIDIVVELIGGENLAFDLLYKAMENGKSVVTANKHMLATKGESLYTQAEKESVQIGYEAAVAGAVPVIRTIKNGFSGNQIKSIHGIVNGTANYILSRMADEGADYTEVLADAQKLGYAEADPAFDVEGTDSAHKIAILASLAFETPIDFSDVTTEGITQITSEDIDLSREFGYVIKLLAIAKLLDDGQVDIRVHPAMVPCRSLIAKVGGADNAIEINADEGGVNMLVGPGAGGGPTASAVISDIIEIARHKNGETESTDLPMAISSKERIRKTIRNIDQLETCYYLRFTTPDKPGVLALLAGELGVKGISIASMVQKGDGNKEAVSVVMKTHRSKEADLKSALNAIDKSGVCSAPTVVIRIENENEQ